MRRGSGTRADASRHVVVDDVAPEHRQLDIADELGRRRAGLGELPGDAADLHDRDTRAVGEHDRHLQDDLQLVADRVGGEVVEGLGAVAGLEQERPAGGDLAERAGQAARLAGEHERWERRELGENLGVRGGIGPWRLLGSGARVPRGRVPAFAGAVAPAPAHGASGAEAVSHKSPCCTESDVVLTPPA